MSTVNDREELRRLHFINALFSQLTGDDLYLAHQIKEAIAFTLTELAEQTRARPDLVQRYDAEFTAAAAKLLTRLFGERRDHGFFHWDALSTLASATPLFARSELMSGLKGLAIYPEGTVLVTNLRAACLPPEQRETRRRRREYEEALHYIRDLTAARTRPGAHLRLLFL